MRLKPLTEFRSLLEEPGRFLMIQGEEITHRYAKAPVHINAVNLRDVIKPLDGPNVAETIRVNHRLVAEQRQRTGRRSGDASTRAYERLTRDNGSTAILMISPPRPDGPPVRYGKPYSAIAKLAENIRPFVAIDRQRIAFGLRISHRRSPARRRHGVRHAP